jgi:3-oxoadipate enol-lactonase
MPFAPIRDIQMYYERGGNAASEQRLLFINGSGGDLRQQPNVIAGPLAADFDLLAFDQRGLGQTDRPDEPYSMADYAADALALLDYIGWQTCRVIGVSFGGMVAQELAVTAPERVERLVLACTSPGGAGGSSYPLHELLDAPPEDAAQFHLKLLDTRGEGAGELMQLISKAMSERAAVGADEAGRDIGYRRQLEARAEHDTYSRLDRLDMPVLIAGGRYDGIAAPSNQEAMHAAIANSRLEWFDGGHVFMLQDPRANDVFREFLLQN